MKEIKLTQGKVAVVDDEDYEYLNQFGWYFNVYAVRMISINGEQKKIWMHRLINNTPDGLETDHINHNRLDNRRDNLRTVIKAQNQQNRLPNKNAGSIYKGVCFQEREKKWRARIQVNGEMINLGYSNSEKDMARAYNKAAIKHHGEFAQLNEII